VSFYFLVQLYLCGNTPDLFRKSAEQISSGKFDLGISKIAGATNYAADLSGKMLSKENAKR